MKKLLILAFWLPALGYAQPSVGQPTPAYHPQHVTGPDAGTDACPV